MHKGPSSQADSLRGVPDSNIRSAALIGASSAFGKKSTASPAVPPKGNGALLAASLAGKKPPILERSISTSTNTSIDIGELATETTGSTISRATPLPSPGSATGTEWLRTSTFGDRSAAAPTIAALAAVSKPRDLQTQASKPSEKPAHRFVDRKLGRDISKTTFEVPTVTLLEASPVPEQELNKMERRNKGTDDTPIAPTTSLVKLFEQTGQGKQPAQSREPTTPPSKPPATKPKPKISPRLEALRHRQEYDEAVAAEEAAKELRGRPPIQGKPSFKRSSSAAAVPMTVIAEPSVLRTKPNLPPPRRSANKPLPPPVTEPSKSPPAKTPAMSHLFSRSQPIQIRKTSSNLSLPEAFDRSSLSPNQNHYQQRSIRQISPHMTGDSLANAIVGANLASRQTSPHRSGTPNSQPPLPVRNQRNHHHSHNPLQHFRTRSNSPSKSAESAANNRISLRTTLRKDESSSSDEGRGKQGKGRKHRFRKHPNKHHEGDRKRWRDTITERERKRYEGLWAANKGLHISSQTPKLALASSSSLNTLPTEDVLDLVVRDIWSRSRLPAHVLAEIWDLVDHRGEHRLTREEFVVGTWLVDQCLKGRKVPSRVMDSVWVSVKLMGVKVRKKNFQ